MFAFLSGAGSDAFASSGGMLSKQLEAQQYRSPLQRLRSYLAGARQEAGLSELGKPSSMESLIFSNVRQCS